MKSTLWWCAMVGIIMCCRAAANAGSEQVEFAKFWTQFRTAALSGEVAKVIPLTNFPFKTQGPDHRDPVIHHDRKSFARLLPMLLTEEEGTVLVEPSRGRTLTVREIIERTATLPPDMMKRSKTPTMGSGWAAVANCEFAKVKGRWKFVLAYIDHRGTYFDPERRHAH